MLHACSSDESAISDEILSARARDGARSAFAELVGRYQDRVYRIALRMSHNPSDAEEIAQETFLLAHRGIATFHGESLFRTWLYRIAVNQALMRRRAAKRRPVQSLELLTPCGVDTPVPAAGGEPPEGADDLAHRKMLADRVHEALAQLDESQRAALVMRDLEGLSSEEAADALGVSPVAVRQRAHRARLRLREQLADLVGALPAR